MEINQSFNGYPPTWCPGCGNWTIGIALKTALSQMGYDSSTVAVVFGIGCSGNMNDFLNAYAIHSLHGRAIANAIGIKIANHKMPVFVIAGDGDCYGEGGNHLIHAARGNHDITVIVHDNRVYGLTTGQVAPTAQKGFKSKSTPGGIIEVPFNPLGLAIVSGATFVAQAFTGNLKHLVEIIKLGALHKGFSLINIIQPCITFNKINTYQYYSERSYLLDNNYDNTNKQRAIERSLDLDKEKFPLGIIYQESRLTYTDQIEQLQLRDLTLVNKQKVSSNKVLKGIYEDFI